VSRSGTSGAFSALAAGAATFLVFAEMDFASGFLRVTNAPYAVPWNGYTWKGLGEFGSMEAVQEGANLEAFGVRLTLSGVDPVNISLALTEHYQGRSCKIWIAPLDSGHQVIADPVLVFDGRMDTMQMEAGQQAVVTVTAESRLADLERPRVRRYNDADQQWLYPGDLGMQFVEQMVEKELVWGAG